MLERTAPPRTVEPAATVEEVEPAAVEVPEAELSAAGKGRGRADRESPRKGQAGGKGAKKIKGRTIYLPDDLFERILVQAHRRDRTISEYVTMILDRQVPDHRTARADMAEFTVRVRDSSAESRGITERVRIEID